MSSPPKEKIETKGGHLPAGIESYVAFFTAQATSLFVFTVQLTYHGICIRPMSIVAFDNVSLLEMYVYLTNVCTLTCAAVEQYRIV